MTVQYKGKYPNRIKEVYSTKEKGVCVVKTNNGKKYTISAKDTNGMYPELGAEISDYINTEVAEQQATKTMIAFTLAELDILIAAINWMDTSKTVFNASDVFELKRKILDKQNKLLFKSIKDIQF